MRNLAGQRQSGFTLIEIMVAMVIGLILTAGASYLFISHKQTYRMAEAVSRIQENGRYAINVLAEDLRMAGYLDCVSQMTEKRFITEHLSELPMPLDYDPVDEVLTVHYASGRSVDLAAPLENSADDLVLEPGSGLDEGDVALITNCDTADWFTVTSVSESGAGQAVGHSQALSGEGKVNEGPELSADYADEDTRVMAYEPTGRSYRVVDSGGTNEAGDAIRSLFLGDEELLPGVEHMEIQFGECVGPDQIRYADWDGVDDKGAIVATRVGFLMHSIERVMEQPDRATYSVAGVNVGPPGSGGDVTHGGDPRLRQVFSATVSLRNEQVEDC